MADRHIASTFQRRTIATFTVRVLIRDDRVVPLKAAIVETVNASATRALAYEVLLTDKRDVNVSWPEDDDGRAEAIKVAMGWADDVAVEADNVDESKKEAR